MISVILAGGKGLRLWPESTEKRPKQLRNYLGQGSLVSMTLRRLQTLGPLLIVCGAEQKELVKTAETGMEFSVLAEPVGRNTAPAVGLVLASGGYEPNEVLGIFPVDHYIENDEEFRRVMCRAEELARQGYMVTVGVAPTYPETGYGYIERVAEKNSPLVKAFHEKPDRDTAAVYLKNGNYLWNTGIFIAAIDTWMKLMQEHLPELYTRIQAGQEAYLRDYSNYTSISLDYAIAEKCKCLAVLEGDFGWYDIGSWDVLAAVLEKDEQGNTLLGDARAIESAGCLARSSQKKLILFGVNDLVVVETEDTILVCPKNRCQELRHVVEYITNQE